MMAKREQPSSSENDVRALLRRYECPVPFHEVRTRFLGSIAAPSVSVSPIKIVEHLWGGALPVFDSTDDANELLGALVMGLWNRLTRHQEKGSPFRLTRVETKPTREALATLALMRRQEIDGFVEGLFGENEEIDLPEQAHNGLNQLAELRASFAAVVDLAENDEITGTRKEMETTLSHLRTMTRHAERQMHTVVVSCALARRQMLAGHAPQSGPLH